MERIPAEELDRYIDNLRTIRSISRPHIQPGEEPDAVLKEIQGNAVHSFNLMQENNALLCRDIYDRAPESLTDEDIATLEAFAGKLFHYSSSEDVALAHRVHQLLLEVARFRNDVPMILKELYFNGVTLHYMNVRDEKTHTNLLGKQIQHFFCMGADYMAQYEQLDKTSRQYILRCIGNMRLGMSRYTYEETREYLEIFNQAMGIFNSPYYRDLDPEFPWDSYIYSMHMDRMTLMGRLRLTDDPELAQEVLKSAEYVWTHQKKTGEDESRLQNWRVSYFYTAARFHAGKCNATEVVDALLEVEKNADATNYSVDGLYHNLTAVSYLLDYASFLSPEEEKRYHSELEGVKKRANQYLASMPINQYPRVVSYAMWELFQLNTREAEIESHWMLGNILAGHRPTYVHSLMVAALTRAIVQRLIETKPDQLVGLMDCKDAAEVTAREREICQMAYVCGLYHDIGKSAVIMYIENNARRLLDEEFYCIQAHPAIGYSLLQKAGYGRYLAPAALYHHCFYNGKGGYPKGCEPCPADVRAIVDALTVSDSLDAATDNIGRCYNLAKPFRALLEELRAQSGTRYAPYVVDLFEDESFCSTLNQMLDTERKKVYLQVYHARDEEEQS